MARKKRAEPGVCAGCGWRWDGTCSGRVVDAAGNVAGEGYLCDYAVAQLAKEPAPLATVEPAPPATVEPPSDLPDAELVWAGEDGFTRARTAWLHAKKNKTNSERTETIYEDTLDSFRAFLLGAGLDFDSDPRKVAMAAQGWAGSRTFSSRRPGLASAATQQQRLSVISSFYEFAMRRIGLFDANPIERVERPKVEPYRNAVPLDPAQLRRQLAEIDRSDPAGQRDHALLFVALTTGRRLSELASLRWRDVVLNGGAVTLTFHAKGGKTMRDTLGLPVARALLAWLHAHYGAALGDLSPTAAIWPSLNNRNRGEPMSTQAVDDVVRRRLGAHVNPHALRHSFAKAMKDAGAPVSDIQARLGHASLATTGIYLRQLEQATNPHADALAELFGGEG